MNTQSREINSIRNVSVSIISQFLSILMNFASKTVFIRILGEDYLGINGLFFNIFLLFSFAEFGIGSAMIYSLYDPIAKRDTAKISALYHFYKVLYRKMSLWITAAGLLVIPFLNSIVHTEKEIEGLWYFYLAFLINTIITNLFTYKTYLIIADQRKYKLSIYQTVFEVLGYIAQIVILLLTRNYLLYLLLICLKTVMTNYVVGREVKKSYPFLKKTGDLEKEEKIKIKKNVKALFIYKFARVLITGTNNILISMMVGTVMVGYYSNYDLVVIGVSSIVTLIFTSLSASVGNLVAEKSISRMKEVFQIVQVASIWISGFTTICMLVLFQDFITLWIGSKYTLPFPVVVIIAMNYYLGCVRDSTKIFREALGIFDKIKNMMIITAGLNILLSIILGNFFGVFGILAATTISVLLTYYWYEPVLIYRAMEDRNRIEYFILQFKSILYLAGGAVITTMALSLVRGLSWTSFLLKIILCLIITNIYYILLLGRRKELNYIYIMIKRIWNRRKD